LTLPEKIAENIVQIADNLSESAVICSFIMFVFSLVAILCIRGIVAGLMEMHRSKSALKKVHKNYSFGQKLCLQHAWLDCLHAKRFCRFLIVTHHSIICLLLAQLLLAILSNIWPDLLPVIAWYTLVCSDCFFIPVCLLNFILDRYPFAKWKHEFRFKKYHNTDDHTSLF